MAKPLQRSRLTPEFRRFVNALVESGRYQDHDDVVRAALRLLMRQEDERAVVIEQLRSHIARGVGDVRSGRTVDGEAFMADWERREAQGIRTRRRRSA